MSKTINAWVAKQPSRAKLEPQPDFMFFSWLLRVDKLASVIFTQLRRFRISDFPASRRTMTNWKKISKHILSI